MSLKPSDVFVPGKFPLDKYNIFADRGRPQEDFTKAVDRAFVPVVFGSYGVGKSSLARFCAKPWELNRRLAYIETTYGKSLADILTRVLEILGYSVTVETTTLKENELGSEAGFGLEGGVLGYLKARIAGKLSRKRKKAIGAKRELLVRSPTDSKIMELCEEAGLFLMIDEMHRGSERLRVDLSAFLKAYANRNHKRFRIAIIGTETDANKLVLRDPGVDRVLQEVAVHTMKESESRQLIFEGIDRLGLKMPEPLGLRVIRSGVGSPFVLQYLAVEMAERAHQLNLSTLTEDMHTEALKSYAKAKAQRTIHQYRLAIETTGEKRYRKRLLHAMAHVEDDYVTMEQLVEIVSKEMGEAVPSTALSGPLRDLKTEKFGSVLTDIESHGGGGRAYNYSTFADPAMKSIVRMIEELAKPGEDIPRELQQDG